MKNNCFHRKQLYGRQLRRRWLLVLRKLNLSSAHLSTATLLRLSLFFLSSIYFSIYLSDFRARDALRTFKACQSSLPNNPLNHRNKTARRATRRLLADNLAPSNCLICACARANKQLETSKSFSACLSFSLSFYSKLRLMSNV